MNARTRPSLLLAALLALPACATEAPPADPTSLLAEGAGALAAGDAARAVVLLRGAAVTGAPLADLAHLLLGRALLAEGDIDGCLAAASRVVSSVQASVRGDEADWLRADALERAERWSEAAPVLQDLARREGTGGSRGPEARERAALALVNSGATAEAGRALRALAITDPDRLGGEALGRARRLAAESGTPFRELDCDESLAVADTLARRGLHAAAASAFQAAAGACGPSAGRADRALERAATTLYLLRENEAAVATAAELERRFASSTRVSGARLVRAKVAWRLGRDAEVATVVDSIIADPRFRQSEDRAEALRIRGVLATETGSAPDGVPWFDRLAREHAASRLVPDTQLKAAWGLLLAGDAEGARRRFLVLAKGEGDEAEEGAYWAAQAAGRLGDSAACVAELTSLATRSPASFHGAEARRALASVLDAEAIRRLDLAAAASGSALPDPGRPDLATPMGQRYEALRGAGLDAYALGEIEAHRRSVKDTDALVLELCEARVRGGAVREAQVLLESRFRRALEDPSRASTRRLLALRYPSPHEAALLSAAGAAGVDPDLCAAIARAESWWQADARSTAGAIGLMQLMPATAERVAGATGEAGVTEASLLDPVRNLELGARLLRSLLDRFSGDEAAAVAAYNAGAEKVTEWWTGFDASGVTSRAERVDRIPYRETRPYARHVLEAAAWYRWLRAVPESSPSGG